MVNPGAIAGHRLVPGPTRGDGTSRRAVGLRRADLSLDEAVLESARATNHRNRALARLLHASARSECDPEEAVELYTRQSCLEVTAATWR